MPFPFTDQTGFKKRPAVIVSSTAYNTARRDVLIMAVTSQSRPAGSIGEVQIKQWKSAGLIKPSVVKPVITTIEASLVIRRLGQLNHEDLQALRKVIADIVG